MTQLVLVATFQAVPRTRPELARRLEEMVTLSRCEPGCIRYDLHVDRSDEHRFVFVETWADDKAWAVHMQTPHVQALLEDALRLTAGGVHVRSLTQVA